MRRTPFIHAFGMDSSAILDHGILQRADDEDTFQSATRWILNLSPLFPHPRHRFAAEIMAVLPPGAAEKYWMESCYT